MTRPDPCPDPDSAVDGGEASAASRRGFLSRVGMALGGLGALLAGLPFLGFLFSPVLERTAEAWRRVGSAGEFPIGETLMVTYLDPGPLPWAGFAGYSAAWVRQEEPGSFVAFSMYCTHTGCPITWSSGAQLFLCPCHGGSFHRDGRVAGGPPPRPLARLPIRLRNGDVEIRTIGAPLTG